MWMSEPADPKFKFDGYEPDEGEEEDEGVHLSNIADDEEEQPEEQQEEDHEEEEEDAPEDDFNAAWEVLELARVIFDSRKDEDPETKLKLADTYLALGDVSLETG